MSSTQGVAGTPVQDRILAAAVRDLAAHGYAGASLERLAGAAGVTKPMVHYYFGSKAGLYERAVAWARGRLAEVVSEAAAAAPAPREALVALVEAAGRCADEVALLSGRAPSGRGEGAGRRASPLGPVLQAAVAPVLEAAQARGLVRTCDADVVSALLAAGLAPPPSARAAGEKAAWARRVVDQVWRGLAPGDVEG